MAYYESLGEIEATNTKARFIQEKYENKDLTDIVPESSKVNPKHQKLDNYLKNRNLLDKAKDSVYNYIKKRIGDSNENIEEDMAKDKKRNNLLVDGRKRRGYVNEDFEENIQISSENQKRLEKLKNIDTSNMTLIPRKQIEHEIKALENGFNSYKEYSESR